MDTETVQGGPFKNEDQNQNTLTSGQMNSISEEKELPHQEAPGIGSWGNFSGKR
jgi:hypothetical protein